MVDKLNKKIDREIAEGLENSGHIKDNYITNGAWRQPCGFSHKLLLVWRVSLNLPLRLLQKQYPIALILNNSVFIFLLALHPCIVNNGLCCFHLASSANPAFFTSLSDAQLLDIYSIEQGEKCWNGLGMAQSSVKAFGRAKIPNVIASAFLIKRKKDIFPDVGEKQYLQLQVQLCCCFC